MKTEELIETLLDRFLTSGEILPAAYVAETIQRHETDNGVEFTPEEILRATRAAGEEFVDSMVSNEHDTEECVTDGLYDGYPIDPLETRVARWEAMRPSTVRRAAIAATLATAH